MQNASVLPTSPLRPALTEGEVHLWTASLDRSADDLHRFRLSLSVQEQARAARFRIDEHRNRFIVRRGVLRSLLSRYLAVDPRELLLDEGGNGKPLVVEPTGTAGVQFNISHSGSLALFAFARFAEVGVDLERMRPVPEMEYIVDRFFSPVERNAFRRAEPDERLRTFFLYWTAKEAFVKATGEGLARPLDSFTVAPSTGAEASVVQEREGAPSTWSLRSLQPCGGFAAAMVVRSGSFTLRYRGECDVWNNRHTEI